MCLLYSFYLVDYLIISLSLPYRLLIPMCLWCIWLATSLLFAQDEITDQALFDQQKADIMDEVYMNPDFLPLVDVEEAKQTLSWLMKSFQQLADQYDARDDKRDELEWEYQDVYVTMEYILSDISNTNALIAETLRKITFSKKHIEDMKGYIQELHREIRTSRENLKSYTLFLYKLNNDFYTSTSSVVSDVKLFVKSDNIADTLSSENLVQMLTLKLEVLLHTLKLQQLSYAEQVMDLNKAKEEYQTFAIQLKYDLQRLQEQKKHFGKLLNYLQANRVEADKNIQSLRKSKGELEEHMQRLQSITAGDRAPLLNTGSKAYNLLHVKDRENGERYFSRPIAPIGHINRYYNDGEYLEKTGKIASWIDVYVPQGTEVYAPAPGIVYKVYESDDIDLNWMIIIHKYWYMTLYHPLSDIFVEPGDIIKRGEIIAHTWGKWWTKGAWLWSKEPHLSYEILHNGEPIDPFTRTDISIFAEDQLAQQYRIKYLSDFFAREVDISHIPKLSGITIDQRREAWLTTYAVGPYRDFALWSDASESTGINPVFGLCIWFAETSYKHFKTKNNIGNVGNNDRGDTVEYPSPLAGVKALFNVLNNQYLGWYNTINELSRFGNSDGYIYASSPYNRQKNVMKCMSAIYGYPIQEDFPFRVTQSIEDRGE